MSSSLSLSLSLSLFLFLSFSLTHSALGDLGTTSDSVTTVEHMIANRNLSMLLHVGDLSYSDCDATKWDTYGLMVENLARERV